MRRKSGYSRQAVTVGCHWMGAGGGSNPETEPNAAPDRRLSLVISLPVVSVRGRVPRRQVSVVVRLSIRVVGASRQDELVRRGRCDAAQERVVSAGGDTGLSLDGFRRRIGREAEPNAAPDRRLSLFFSLPVVSVGGGFPGGR